MGAGTARLRIPAGFTRDLRRGVLQAGSRKALQQVQRRSRRIRQQIGDLLVSAFDSTEVARALRGDATTDLAAHFGLTDSQASRLADNMGLVIRNSVKVTVRQFRVRGAVQIRAVESDFSDFLGLPNSSYVSQPSSITIPVMQWLLLDPNIDVGQAAYNIVFKGESGRFDTRINKISRSGRAIMVSLKQLGGSSGYVLPSIVRGDMGGNFIELAISQEGVAQRIGQIVFTAMKGVG